MWGIIILVAVMIGAFFVPLYSFHLFIKMLGDRPIAEDNNRDSHEDDVALAKWMEERKSE